MISFVRPFFPPKRAAAVLVFLAPAFAQTSPAHTALAGSSRGAWSIVPSPTSRAETRYLYGVAGTSSSDVWAVGFAGRTVPGDGYAEHALIEHWNGSAWSLVSAPATGSPDSQFLGVTSVSSRTLWTVGFAGKHRTSAEHTLIERMTEC
jgi:hypothetical protein